jgi:hypothetical protein
MHECVKLKSKYNCSEIIIIGKIYSSGSIKGKHMDMDGMDGLFDVTFCIYNFACLCLSQKVSVSTETR